MAVSSKPSRKPAAPSPQPRARYIRARERDGIQLTDQEKSELCRRSLVSFRTIEYWAAGYRVSRTNRMRLEDWMQRLGFELRPRARAA